jgi:secretory phospholipase A2
MTIRSTNSQGFLRLMTVVIFISYILSEISVVMTQESCNFQCKTGKPVHNPSHTPGHNGCGAHGLEIHFKHCAYLNACCNQHDLCYDMCGNSRDRCDDLFKTCNNAPKNVQPQLIDGCLSAGSLMFTTVSFFGCAAYNNAQKNACLCIWISEIVSRCKSLI